MKIIIEKGPLRYLFLMFNRTRKIIMAKQRIYEIAKTLGISNKEIIDQLERMGVKNKKHSSGLDDATAETILNFFKRQMREKQAAIIKETVTEDKKPEQKKVNEKKVSEKKIAKKEKEVTRKDDYTSDRKLEKKPGMVKALESLKRIDVKKWPEPKPFQKKVERPKAPVKKLEQKEKPPQHLVPRKRVLKLPEGTTVKEFAELLGIKVPEVVKKFMELGYMPTINQPVDPDAAQLIAEGVGIKLELTSVENEEDLLEEKEAEESLESRAPIVTVMGHVDHGKTSLLDSIRKTNVTAKEAGGITQHIGAYKITLNGRDIVFLDTPGHEAFTTMRARGSKVTDIVILVVAADDGVMPQTIEAINHAKAAEVPIVVAINKIDKPNANIERVKQQLTEHGVIPEEWGGQNIFVKVSAKTKEGIDQLLEMILLQADIMELKADYNRLARGSIIESRMEKGKGPVATVLIQSGHMKVGDPFLVGTTSGKVRVLIDDKGNRIKEATPSTPVEVSGFSELPEAGQPFIVMADENKARQIAVARLNKEKRAEMKMKKTFTLDDFYAKAKEGETKELNIIIKADTQGSAEAIKDALSRIVHPEVKVNVIHSFVGGINESDVMLASASSAIIVGFSVRPDSKALSAAEREGVDIRLYSIIYDIIDDIKKALEGLLSPTITEKILGRAEVLQVFHISKVGTVAGSKVVSGVISRASKGIRVIRDNIVIYDSKIASLKRYKEDIKEAKVGYECGIVIENFNDIKEGDILENYTFEETSAKL